MPAVPAVPAADDAVGTKPDSVLLTARLIVTRGGTVIRGISVSAFVSRTTTSLHGRSVGGRAIAGFTGVTSPIDRELQFGFSTVSDTVTHRRKPSTSDI
ncbi:MAG: hypothetical protein AAFR76_07275 [Planctomycetota bacterium]